MTQPLPNIVHIKKNWYLSRNPFPSQGIARLGGEDLRENGLLFDPAVQDDKFREAAEKFVLGAAYSGLKFGFLWSLGTGLHGDARGFGKSSLMQYLTEHVNEDFGRDVFVSAGLEESDAEEQPVCAMMASFDMANVRSLHAVFYAAVEYVCRFHRPDTPALIQRLYDRLVQVVGSSEEAQLLSAVNQRQLDLTGRTLGPPIPEFLELLCSGDFAALNEYLAAITPTRRTRNGAQYLATLLIFIKTAGINHVLLSCDQLEDFAATTTTKQKRTLEIERFRDYLLEIQPMADMLSVVVTMHPRAVQAIAEMWHLADLPSYDHDRQENKHRVVVLERIRTHEKTERLLRPYIESFRTSSAPPDLPSLFPFSDDAVAAILSRSDGKPRDLLRKANALVEAGGEANWEVIDESRAAELLDAFDLEDDEGDLLAPTAAMIPGDVEWGSR
jgi:hypothetical protein